jgi:two-component sensor histidine kinase
MRFCAKIEEIAVTTVYPGPPVAEMGTLLRELNHRIANQFASAIDLISSEAVRAEDREAKAVLSSAVELLHGQAGVHRALRMPRQRTLVDAATYLGKLCRAFQGAVLDRLDIQLTWKGDRLPLQPERCWRLGLIIHELAANAASHAFDGRSGEIKIRLAHMDGLIRCVVSDNGSAAGRARQGQGLRIVGDLARTLDGRIEHGDGGGFRSVVLSFPLTERERHANCAIDKRRMRLSRERKPPGSVVAGKGRTGSFDRRSHPNVIASVQASSVPPRSQGEAPSRSSTEMLAQLFSPSYSTDAL